MFFIVGLGGANAEQKRDNFKTYCPHCHNQDFWIREKQVQNLTLFFLPVFPVKTNYAYYCPICRHGRNINKEDFEAN
jgi:hypothetical protein